MIAAKQMSTAAVMKVIVLVALELALFQGVWRIVLVPLATMAVLAVNLGVFFVLVRPPVLETRIIGMLLGGVAACFSTTVGLNLITFEILNHVQNVLVNRATTLPDQQGLTVTVLRTISVHIFVILFAMLDVLGVALILAGGWLDSRWRSHRARARAAVPPLDGRASSPL
jgi:hypothetical protein